jgi:uncharacterized protein (DUF58 family)
VTRRAEFVLGQRQVYVLPTRHGLMLGLVLLALLLASINYGNGLAYLLTFLLTSTAIVSVLHTQRNLLRLRVAAGASPPVFAGEDARFTICLHNAGRQTRRALRLEYDKHVVARGDALPLQAACLPLCVPATRRGWLACPPVVISTDYPLALFRAWSPRLSLAQRCLVYPAPAADAALAALVQDDTSSADGSQPGGEDYSGLRPFRQGDTPQRISWKTLAGGRGLHTKEFLDGAPQTVYFDWDALAPHPHELRLSLLCRALLDADAAGQHYGLRLPGATFAPDHGEAHRQRCLEALALFDLPPHSEAA